MKKINILVAPNAFKGNLTSVEVAHHIAVGLSFHGHFEVNTFPIADGGDGTLEVLVSNFGGKYRDSKVFDPLGREITARWGVINGDTAVIEMANASGIKLLKPHEYNPLATNSYGTGQLILEAISNGFRKIVVGIGGSATVDGGTGMLKALGARFYDNAGREIADGNFMVGASKSDSYRMDISKALEKMEGVELVVLSDVDNPLLGERGAARVFGPQKGADEKMVEELEKSMKEFSQIVIDKTGNDFTTMKGAGAAGGVGFMLRAMFNARVMNGMDYLVEETDLEERVRKSDIVITGEGKIDAQTLEGKGPGKIALLAKKYRKKCLGICGRYEDAETLKLYFDALLPIDSGTLSHEEILKHSRENLEIAGRKLGSTIEQQ